MRISTQLFLALLFLSSCKSDDPAPPVISDQEYEGYTLVWSDEFNDSEINLLNWNYEIGDGTDYGLPPGWGNSELQLYSDAATNAYIEDDGEISALVISAEQEADSSYSSAKLTTQGLQSFRYGRIEASIKLPTAQGMWPAFWMLGDNISEVDWPGCGEIDIMELVGHTPEKIYGSAHYTSENQLNSISAERSLESMTFDEDFHQFRIDWSPESISFSLDGELYNTIQIEPDMLEFKRFFYLILNVAVGGSWPGSPNSSTSFPQKMYVDYVRAYTKDDLIADTEPPLDIAEETIGVIIPDDITQLALNSALNQFPEIELKSYGAGGEPEVSASEISVDGDLSLLFAYPGGNWGGGWFEMDNPLDLSSLAASNLVFSLQSPDLLADAEVKLEAIGNSAAVFLIDYEPQPIDNGFVEYTIPISDFIDLDLTEIRIPFALWNPKDDSGAYPELDILVDNIYWQ